MPDVPPLSYTLDMLATYFGVSRTTIKTWYRDELIVPCAKVGSVIRFDIRDCEARLKKHTDLQRRAVGGHPQPLIEATAPADQRTVAGRHPGGRPTLDYLRDFEHLVRELLADNSLFPTRASLRDRAVDDWDAQGRPEITLAWAYKHALRVAESLDYRFGNDG